MSLAQSPPADSLLTLPRALAIASQNYPSIKSKLAEIDATKADLNARVASFLPGATFQAQGLYATSNGIRGAFFPNEGTAIPISGGIKVNGPTRDAVWNSFSSLVVNWKAVTFGRNKADLALAQSDIQRANADYQQELFVHRVNVADAYLMSLIFEQSVRIQTANLGRIQSFRTVMQANTRSGLRPGVDSSLADAELAQANLLLIESRRLSQQQRVRLGELMGTPRNLAPLDTNTFRASLPPDFTSSEEMLRNHPVLNLYRRQIDYGLARAESIRKSYLPAISLIGSFWARGSGIKDYTTPEGNFIYNPSLGAGLPFRVADYFAGFSTIWKFTDIFRIRQETRAQLLRVQSDQHRYDEALLRIQGQQETANLKIQNAYDAARQAPIQLGAAQAAYQQAQARYSAGLSNIYEFTQAFTLLNRAEIDQSVTTNNVWRALLLKSAAEGDLTDFVKLTTK